MTAQTRVSWAVLFFLLLVCAFFIIRHACLVPTTMMGTDASVFATIGWSWVNGHIPYKELFDHKGPVLYALNALGILAGDGEFYGIVYIEVLNLFLFSALFLFINRNNSIVFFIFFLIIYKVFIAKNLGGGNYTEEYALLFNAFAACAWLARSRWRFYIYGLCGALLFFLRPNLAALSLIIFLVDIVKSKNLFKNILQTGIGFGIPTGIILFYFYIHDALYDFYQSYIIFNIHYTNKSDTTSLLKSYYLILIKHRNYIFMLICLFMLCWIFLKKRKYFLSSFLFLLVPFAFSCISGRTYSHYILIMAPTGFIFFSILFENRNTDERLINFFLHAVSRRTQRLLLSGVVALFLGLLAATLISSLQRFDDQGLRDLRRAFRAAGLHPGARVMNFGNHTASSIYYLSHTFPPEKDFFPLTATSTEASRRLMRDQQNLCPERTYDFLVLAPGQHLSPSCPYVPVPVDFEGGMLYKFSQPEGAKNEEDAK